jgi:intein/homing endonuclease
MMDLKEGDRVASVARLEEEEEEEEREAGRGSSDPREAPGEA